MHLHRHAGGGGLLAHAGEDQLAEVAMAMVVRKQRETVPSDASLLGLPWRAGYRLVMALAGVYPRVWRPPSLPLVYAVEGFVGTMPLTVPVGRCLVAYMAFRAGDAGPEWGVRRIEASGLDAGGQVAWVPEQGEPKRLLDDANFKDFSDRSIGGVRDEDGLDPLGASCVKDVVAGGLEAVGAVRSSDMMEELLRGRPGRPFLYWGCLDLDQVRWTPRLVGLALRLRSPVIRQGLARFARTVGAMTANQAVALNTDRIILSLPWAWASALVGAVASVPRSSSRLVTVAGWKGEPRPQNASRQPLVFAAFEALRPTDDSAVRATERLLFEASRGAEDRATEQWLQATVLRVVHWASSAASNWDKSPDQGQEARRRGLHRGKRPLNGRLERRAAPAQEWVPDPETDSTDADVRVMTYNVSPQSAGAAGCGFGVVKTIVDAVMDGVGIVCLQGSTRALEGQLLAVHPYLTAERLNPEGASLAVLFDARDFTLLTQAQARNMAGFAEALCVLLLHRNGGKRLCVVNVSRAPNHNQTRLAVDLQRLLDRLQRDLLAGPGTDVAFVVCGDLGQRVDRPLLGGRWAVANTGRFLTCRRNGVLGAFDNILAGNGAEILEANSPAGRNYGAMIRKPLDRFAQACGDHLPLAARVSLSGQAKRRLDAGPLPAPA